MKPALQHFGEGRHPVVVVDDFTGDVAAVRGIAEALAPFPESANNFYPGLRRYIRPADQAAYAYAESLLRGAAPFIGGGFGCKSFYWLEASFSMVTTAPGRLAPPQRAPHFDSTKPGYLALLHYLNDTAGTAFYRQRQTGIEQVTDGNVRTFVESAMPAAAAATGYIHGSDSFYEQIGMVEGKADRLVIYHGSMLHSGIIAPDEVFSADPRHGRLTANLFVQGK